jgi:hypothetical protein
MGETPMRLRNVTDLIVSGENKWGGFSLSLFMGKYFTKNLATGTRNANEKMAMP